MPAELTADQAREAWLRHDQGTPWWILAKQGETTEGALRQRVLKMLGVVDESVAREEACGCEYNGPSQRCEAGRALWQAMQEAGRAANGNGRGWPAYAAARQTWMKHLADRKTHLS